MKKLLGYRTVFAASVGLGAFLGSQMILFVVLQMSDVYAGWNVLQYCLNVVGGFIQEPIVAYVVFDLFIGYSFARFCIRLFAQWNSHRRWMCRMRREKNRLLTDFYMRFLKDDGLVVMNDEKPFALVFGMFRPRIAMSTAMIAQLTVEEIKAVYAHELYHSKRFHPLKMFTMTLLAETFSYFPLFRQALHHYKCWTEIEADRYAVRVTGDVESLGSALLKMIRLYQGNGTKALTVHFADYAVNYRIMCILKPEEPVKIPVFSLKALVISGIGVLGITVWVIGGCLL